MEALLETKIFKVSVERLLLNGGQTLYMVGIALLIGTVLGTLLALVLVLCRKGGLVKNKVLHSIVSLYINVVRSVPFIILLVTIMPLTRAILYSGYDDWQHGRFGSVSGLYQSLFSPLD